MTAPVDEFVIIVNLYDPESYGRLVRKYAFRTVEGADAFVEAQGWVEGEDYDMDRLLLRP